MPPHVEEAWDDYAGDEAEWTDDPDAPQERDLRGGGDEDDVDPCPSCGRPVSHLAEKCPHCGDWIVAGGGGRRPGLWTWLIVAVLVGLTLVLTFSW